jgi:hypothetical protein
MPAYSGPDTSHSGRTQKAGPPSSSPAAVAPFVPVLAAVIVSRSELQQASATPVLELDVVAASRSASVLEAALEPGHETGPGAAAGSVVAVAVAVAAVGLEAAAGFGADSEVEFVPAEEEEPRAVEAVPGDSTMSSDCPAPDMAASTPSGVAAAVGPVAFVVTEAVIGVEAAATGIALPHKRHFDLDWCVGQDAAVYRRPWHPGTPRRISSGHMCLRSTHSLAAGRQADHSQGLAVQEHATRGGSTQTAVVEKPGAVARRLSKCRYQWIERKGKKGSLHSL